ncbi:MAG TPA: MFS transporter [Gaiellaceae bacterium]|jgi:MFS family permease|nr:MFS transporter [Gaiellaceae bacterium]
MRERMRDSFRALREVFRNRALRQLQLAWAASIIGSWAYTVALVVYAYDQGGASAVALVAVIRWVPAAVASPFAAILGDRYPRVRVMLGADLLRASALGAMAVCVVTDAPAAIIYVLASVVAVLATVFDPAQSALIPSLARTPEELTAANVSSSTLESLGFCIGPALGGILLTLTNVWVVFVVTAATFLWSALMLAPLLRASEPPLTHERPHLLEEATAGFRAIGSDPRLRLVIGLFGAQTLVNGAFGVLVAVSAFQLLDLGSGGVGYLWTAVGVGGLIGGAFSLALVGHRRLATTFGIAVAGTGGPLLILGVLPRTGAALIAFGLVGFANIICDVSGFTILQRGTPSEVLSRVFGVLHSLIYATIAIGAVLAPPLIDAVGVRWTLVIVGSLLPVLSLLTHTSLTKLDTEPGDPHRLQLLQAIPIFSPLSPPVLERLAAELTPVQALESEEIIRKGDHGDRFYVVSSGEVEVLVDGRPPRREGAGSYFGEIALLRDVPRTATVRAASDVELFALDRDDFLPAVTGHSGSVQAAEAVIGARMGMSTV